MEDNPNKNIETDTDPFRRSPSSEHSLKSIDYPHVIPVEKEFFHRAGNGKIKHTLPFFHCEPSLQIADMQPLLDLPQWTVIDIFNRVFVIIDILDILKCKQLVDVIVCLL